MESLLVVGRKFYAVCLTGLGIQQLVYAGFLPVILPAWPVWIPGVVLWAYLFGAILIISGVAILFEKFGRTIALISGGVFLLLLALCHVPHLIFFKCVFAVPFVMSRFFANEEYVGPSETNFKTFVSVWVNGELFVFQKPVTMLFAAEAESATPP